MPAPQPETEAEIIKARRARWKGAQDCWQKFAEAFLVGKRNFLFEGGDKDIFNPDTVKNVMARYDSLRGKNREADFIDAAAAAYSGASRPEKLVFAHALFIYKLIAKPQIINEANIGKKQNFVNCLKIGDFVDGLHWNGVAHTGMTCKECGASVGFILKVFEHLGEFLIRDCENRTLINAAIRRFCQEHYHAKEKGAKWMVDILLWYVAPNEYEPIISREAKKQIVKSPYFAHYIENSRDYRSYISRYSGSDIVSMAKDEFERNKLILWLRPEILKFAGGVDDFNFNFYDSNVKRLWFIDQTMPANEHEQRYLQWLLFSKIRGAQKANKYFNALKSKKRQMYDLAKKLGVIDDVKTLLDIRDKNEFESVKNTLESHENFVKFNTKSKGVYGQALHYYNEYLAEYFAEGELGDSDSSYDEDEQENGDNPMTNKEQIPLNRIFYGPPGTGKTFHAIPAALEIIGGEAGFDELRKEGQIAMVTFHENFAYEEFIEGIKPVLNTGELSYQMEAGIFKEIAKKADESRQAGDGKNYVLIIDEINRGNLSRIFGELITLIESDKRLGQENELRLTLPYSKEEFGVPDNLYIIGTMNTADRSTTKLDTALRRRFHFVEMMPNPEEAAEHSSVPDVDCGKLLKAINRQIRLWRDREHQIGHTYFMGLKSIDDLKDAFQDKIIPLLQEYFFADWGKIDLALNKNGFIVSEKAQADDEEMTLYEKLPSNDPAWTQAANYKKIYGEE